MINLHVMNYDEHGLNSFIDNPLNGLERFLQEWHNFGIESDNIYMHINDLDYHNKSISIEYKKSEEIQKGYFEFIDFENEQKVASFFLQLIETFGIENIIFHYNKRERLDYISYIPKLNKTLVLHDAMLFSETGGFSETYDYERSESLSNALKNVDSVIAVSQFIYNVTCKFYPEFEDKIKLIENDLYTIPYVREEKKDIGRENLSFVILGNITVPIKGSQIIHDLVMKDSKNDYHVLGRISEHENKNLYKSVSEYDFKTLPQKIKVINPDIVIIPSMWDEVFGFTALEATYLGYPVLCFNVGDLKRIKERSLGFVVDDRSSDAMYQKITYLEKNRDAIIDMNNKIKIYSNAKVHDSIQRYEQLLVGKGKVDLIKFRTSIHQINIAYCQYVHLNKVDQSQYLVERNALEHVVATLQEEIQTYLNQLSEYHKLHEHDVQHIQALNDKIKITEEEFENFKNTTIKFKLKNKKLIKMLKVMRDYKNKKNQKKK